jgi:phosphopantothenoylcysteine decarboxylase
MANVLLGVTGSVAAIRAPALYQELRAAGYAVKVVATRASLYFFNPGALDAHGESRRGRDPSVVVLDEDEWPGRDAGRHYEREDAVLHIELRRWADLFLIAPLDANTLAKLANGLADNCLTCVWRAWDTTRPVILAPAMNTLMWDHPHTARHLRQLAEMAGGHVGAATTDLDSLVRRINETCPRLRVVAPQSKRLACGDVGTGGLATLEDIVAAVRALLATQHARP